MSHIELGSEETKPTKKNASSGAEAHRAVFFFLVLKTTFRSKPMGGLPQEVVAFHSSSEEGIGVREKKREALRRASTVTRADILD